MGQKNKVKCHKAELNRYNLVLETGFSLDQFMFRQLVTDMDVQLSQMLPVDVGGSESAPKQWKQDFQGTPSPGSAVVCYRTVLGRRDTSCGFCTNMALRSNASMFTSVCLSAGSCVCLCMPSVYVYMPVSASLCVCGGCGVSGMCALGHYYSSYLTSVSYSCIYLG